MQLLEIMFPDFLLFFLDSVVCLCLSWRVSLRLEAIHESSPYLCKVRKDASTSVVYCTDIYWIKHPSSIFPDHFDFWSSAVHMSALPSFFACRSSIHTLSCLILFVKRWRELISRYKPVKQNAQDDEMFMRCTRCALGSSTFALARGGLIATFSPSCVSWFFMLQST